MIDRATWVAQLDAVASRAVTGPLRLGPLEAPFRAAIGAERRRAPRSVTGEIALWWARVDPALDVRSIVERADTGSILEPDRFAAIEVWIDAELAALHALWWLAAAGRASASRVAAARDWHLEHTEPDNGTNRPWAIHVFAAAGTGEHEQYAATLLHDCLVLEGRPSALAGAILRDAAEGLRTTAT